MLKGAVQGFTAELSSEEVEKLKKDSRVARVEHDYVIKLDMSPLSTTTTTVQTTPWGVTRTGMGSGIGKRVWIIDSGIQLNHPDLNVDVTRSRSFISSSTSPNDQNGHGTMCAGIIAAKANTVGVRGVAAGASVVAMRVFDATGSGTTSSVIAALNHIYTYGVAGDVVNMSLGGPASTTVDDAVKRVAARGLYVVIAAGNSAVNIANTSPARVNAFRVFTVSAMSQGDYWASFSNFGSPTVDYCAPGVNITSTTIGGGYASGAGTSYAAPHVAGILAAKGNAIITSGYVKNDPDGVADRIAHM